MSQFLNRLLALRIDDQNALFTELEARIEANIASAQEAGTYNLGVEALVAEHFEILEREIVYTHPETNAHTELVKLLRRDRLRPRSAADALAALERARRRHQTPAFLAINERSEHAALIVPAPNRMLEDGGFEPRVSVIRPNTIDRMDASLLDDTFYREAPEAAWRIAWENHIATLPTHTEKTFWLVTGLLLPIWTLLPEQNMRIRRLTTHTGEHLLGRMLAEAESYAFRRTLGLGLPTLATAQVQSAVMREGASFTLINGWRLTRRLVMRMHRLEVEGPTGNDVQALKHLGCHTEIISFRTRIFVDPDDPTVLAAILERWPLDPEHTQAA